MTDFVGNVKLKGTADNMMVLCESHDEPELEVINQNRKYDIILNKKIKMKNEK